MEFYDQPTGEQPKTISIFSWILASLYVLAFLALAKVTPVFAGIFKDFNAPLPVLTALVLSVPGAWYILMGFFSGALLILKDLYLRRKTSTLINVIALVLIFLLIGGATLAVFAPIFKLHEIVGPSGNSTGN